MWERDMLRMTPGFFKTRTGKRMKLYLLDGESGGYDLFWFKIEYFTLGLVWVVSYTRKWAVRKAMGIDGGVHGKHGHTMNSVILPQFGNAGDNANSSINAHHRVSSCESVHELNSWGWHHRVYKCVHFSIQKYLRITLPPRKLYHLHSHQCVQEYPFPLIFPKPENGLSKCCLFHRW